MVKKKIKPPPLELLNRELGVLAAQERVLALAAESDIPLLERLRYVSIVSNNLDEFYEIRVAGLLEQRAPNGQLIETARALLEQIAEQARHLVARQYALLNSKLLPALRAEGIAFLDPSEWNREQREWAQTYFDDEVEPLLTPIALDPTHPFPRILNKSLNFIIEVDGQNAFGRSAGFAILQAPRALPRIVPVPSAVAGFAHGFVLLSSVIQAFADRLFPGLTVKAVHQFRVTRNGELDVEDAVTNWRLAIQDELGQRKFAEPVRLEVSSSANAAVVNRLLREFSLNPLDCFQTDGPVNLVRLQNLIDLVDRADLKFPLHEPSLPVELTGTTDLFDVLRKRDLLLHHPYESFVPVIEFLRSAAIDPQVVAIKQTIYRTGTDSALMESLILAARAGKEVTVVVELMARFDEEANSNWAARLEEVGAHVVYGVFGFKTHAKMAMVVRREKDKLRRYVHLGTGNYNVRTARLYEDFGLLTADAAVCDDVEEVFRRLTGLGTAGNLKQLLQSPFTLQSGLIEAIEREIEHAKAGRNGRIIAKINALTDETMVQALYRASQAGVRIDLIVRGVCTLRPGVKGMSENIRVRSIFGRFLEHSRVYYFRNGGKGNVWLASADWMQRNLVHRVEIAFPVRDRKLRRRIIDEGLREHLRDTGSAWIMQSDGKYERVRPRGGTARVSQQQLLRLLNQRNAPAEPAAALLVKRAER